MRHGTVLKGSHKPIVFDKETALLAVKNLKRGRHKEVLRWLEAVARVFPSSAERERERIKRVGEGETSKQKARKLKLKEGRNGREERQAKEEGRRRKPKVRR